MERRRISQVLGREITFRYVPLPDPAKRPFGNAFRQWTRMVGQVFTDPITYRDIRWVLVHALTALPLAVLTALLWPLFPVTFGLILLLPKVASGQARMSAWLLREPPWLRLAERVTELTQTRAEALTAHSAELQRIERDLHDGVQAQLVSIALRLGLVEREAARHPELAGALPVALIEQARLGAETALADLRQLVRGLYPPLLADRGLAEAVRTLAARGPLPVTVTIRSDTVGELPAALQTAAYFAINEALSNVYKHSQATRAWIELIRAPDLLEVVIFDDGRGGADETRGTGLAGLRRRVAAFDGRLELTSPPGGPTRVHIHLPCPV